MTLLLAVALAETGTIDTAVAYAGAGTLVEEEVPEALACVTMSIGEVSLDDPFELAVNNGCAFTVQVRQPDCEEDTLGSDHEGCARLEVAAGGADREGLPFIGGDRTDLQLEWFDPAQPEVVATSTWRLDKLWADGGGGDSWDPDWDMDEDLDAPLSRCGCSTGSSSPPLAVGLVGLLLVGWRRHHSLPDNP